MDPKFNSNSADLVLKQCRIRVLVESASSSLLFWQGRYSSENGLGSRGKGIHDWIGSPPDTTADCSFSAFVELPGQGGDRIGNTL